MKIVMEHEDPADMRSMFRIFMEKVVAKHLTAAQAQYLVRAIFERMVKSGATTADHGWRPPEYP
jgi:hypothetical protein